MDNKHNIKSYEKIIRANFKHLDNEHLQAILSVFEIGVQDGYIKSLDKDSIIEFCNDFCKYANIKEA